MNTDSKTNLEMATEQMQTAFAENVCLELNRQLGAQGIVMLILRPNDRVEVISALSEEVNDFPGKVRRLADEIESGGGMPCGRHLKKMSQQ